MAIRNIPNAEIERAPKEVGRVVLEEIQRSEDLPGMVSSEQAFSAVMCALEQALDRGGVERLERGLPAGIRALVARCEAHVKPPTDRPRNAGEFLHRVGAHLHLDDAQAQELTRVVFHAVHQLMSIGEVDALAQELPEDLRSVWRAGDRQGDPSRASRPD